ncbi:MAG: hypothetical protein ABI333_16775 [bacterium]
MRIAGTLVLLFAVAGCGGGSKGAKPLTGAEERELRSKAAGCFERGEYGCAMEALRVVLQKRSTDPLLLNRFAVAARLRYYQSGDEDYRDQELEALRKAAKLLPGSAVVQVNVGTTCWEMGLRREAARAYRRALELKPKHADAALIRERIAHSTKEVEEEEP